MTRHPGYLFSRLIHIRGLRAVSFLLISGGVFAAIAASIRLPNLIEVDRATTHAVQHFESLPANLLFFTATFLGNTITLIVVAVAVAIGMFLHRHRHAAALALLSLLSLPFDYLIKFWAVRPRPDQVDVLIPVTGLSFPSGHAMGSTAVYGFIACLIWMRERPGALRTAGTIFFGMLPLVIALSRIYVGAHWLSDVVAGMAAGSFLLVPLVSLYKHWHRVTPPVAPDAASRA